MGDSVVPTQDIGECCPVKVRVTVLYLPVGSCQKGLWAQREKGMVYRDPKTKLCGFGDSF